MTELAGIDLADRLAREEALDTSRSILVQAPAGSGKTELLVQRFLKLLAEVEEPEQVLAITFTKAATAEMRHRVLRELEQAKHPGVEAALPGPATLRLAIAALENSDRRGWRLLDHSQRLNIQTIDSLCLRIARQMPLRARAAAALEPLENALPLYRSAARKTFDRLGGGDIELNQALAAMLALRDSNLKNCESLIAGMLATRDQWGRIFPVNGAAVDWESTRAHFERPFKREIESVLRKAHALLSYHPEKTRDLLRLADYACGNLGTGVDIRLLAGLTALPEPLSEALGHWHCLCNFLLTKAHNIRKRYSASEGFPSNGKNRKDMAELVDFLRDLPGLQESLTEIRHLPPAHYTDNQWQGLRYMFTVLRQAKQELEVVFAEQNAVDFVELGNAAREVLDGPSGDGASVDQGQQVLHLLVDEFQDTSRSQYQLTSALLRGWRRDDGRTFFLVGDPMQSIYMFRQADVELFKLVGKHGFAADNGRLPVKMLRLSTNFRSRARVVTSLNNIFETIFPHEVKEGAGAVDFLPGNPKNPDEQEGLYKVHPGFAIPQSKTKSNSSQRYDPRAGVDPQRNETEEVLKIIRGHLPRIEKAALDKTDFTVAVLARAKNHVARIADALRDEEIPFRAVELETLSERQEILDLQSLTRALLHPMDRIAWLAVLRAPWCGLELSDLHLLCGTDERQSGGGAVALQIKKHLHLLKEGSRERVVHVISVLQAALRARYRQSSFSSWIERTWHSLGGPACVDETGNENTRAYFSMLENFAPDGIAATGESMQDQIDRLFACPDPSVGERCGVQIMTIHKAKGLGFDVVLVPGLHRLAQRDSPALIQYLERARDEDAEIIASPIDRSGDETSALNRWLKRQRTNREAEERKRMLYVACTRAREEVHLFGTATVTNAGVSCRHGTLLHSAWPALHDVFAASYADIPVLPASSVVAFRPAPVDGQPVPGILETVAAKKTGTTLHRLPRDWKPTPRRSNVTVAATNHSANAVRPAKEKMRPQASRSTRTLGTVVHAIFEDAARLLESSSREAPFVGALSRFHTRAVTLARNEGLPPREAESCARVALGALQAALADAEGLWILSPHREAQTESSWTGLIDGDPRTLRIDRCFRAGQEPGSDGSDFLWIIDYKTATHGQAGLATFLEKERLQYAEQLESYGRMMRLAQGPDLHLRLGLYYPLMQELIWWPA